MTLAAALERHVSSMATPDSTDAQYVVGDLVNQEVFGSWYRKYQRGLVVESYLSAHARENQ